MSEKLSNLKDEIKLLSVSIPWYMPALFAVSVVVMNLLANKSIDGLPSPLALDTGFTVSWLSFLCMDTITKHYGPRASVIVAVFAMLVNWITCFVFALASVIPGTWGAYYDYGELDVINTAINGTISGSWYIVFGSSLSFLLSGIVNSFSNYAIGKHLKKDNFGAFAIRSYVSTAIGQFVDNFTFAFVVSQVLFGWTLPQCIAAAFAGMLIELLCEVVFSPIGYRITRNWKKNKIGEKYIQKYFAK